MSEETKVAKIAFIGAGGHATGSLYPCLRMIPEIDLVAVCDLNEELARRAARTFGARSCYTDMDKMFAEQDINGAIVCGAPQMHCEVGKRCLDHGVPIFVEKPSAITSGEGRDLAQHADDKGLWGAVAYMKRHSTCYKMAKTITEKEEFGQLNEMEVRFTQGLYPQIWGIEENARGFLIGQVIHIFNLIRFFGGEVDEVYSKLRKIDDEGRFGYAITLAFESGAIGVANLNCFEGPEWKITERLALSGYECRIEVNDMIELKYCPRSEPLETSNCAGRSQSVYWRPDWTEMCGMRAEGAFGYTGELQNFARAILGTEKITSTLWDGMKDLQVAEAVWKSANSDKPEKVG